MYKGYTNSVLIKRHFNDPEYFGSKYSYKAVTSNANYLWLTGNYSTLHADYQNNDIKVGGSHDVVYGETGHDFFVTNLSGAYSTLYGGAGNDKIWGGDGADVFIYSAGKDIINDYKTGEDTIQIEEGKISKATVKGSDVVFTVDKGTLTIKNTKAKKLSMMDSAGNEYVTMVGGATTSNVTNSTKSSFKIDTWIKTVNATKRTKTIKITGNTLANSISGGTNKDTIYGGDGNDTLSGNKGDDKLYGQAGADKLYGNAGNDSLWGGKGNDILSGGKGNDSLWGDAGKDTFLYSNGDGKDTICGFANDDLLKITGKFSGTYNKKKKEAYFKVGSTANAITLKEFTASTFNVNGMNYKISGTKLVKK